MTDDELDDLRVRIGRLGPGAQLRLLELVLADNRRSRAELQAENRAEIAALLEWERAQESKRAAG